MVDVWDVFLIAVIFVVGFVTGLGAETIARNNDMEKQAIYYECAAYDKAGRIDRGMRVYKAGRIDRGMRVYKVTIKPECIIDGTFTRSEVNAYDEVFVVCEGLEELMSLIGENKWVSIDILSEDAMMVD